MRLRSVYEGMQMHKNIKINYNRIKLSVATVFEGTRKYYMVQVVIENVINIT